MGARRRGQGGGRLAAPRGPAARAARPRVSPARAAGRRLRGDRQRGRDTPLRGQPGGCLRRRGAEPPAEVTSALMLPWSADLAGRLDRHVIDSDLLRGNPLGDPHERPLWVYVPPGYDFTETRYPAVYVIQGYTGHVQMWENRTPFRQPFIETADALF